jgi:DNA-binding MarR family transcriptional regulator
VVSLTTAGRKQLASFRKLVQRVEEDILGPLDDEERATLHQVLFKLAAHRDARYVAAVPAA